jgi:V/A-type H+-transporting ATPase subunit C
MLPLKIKVQKNPDFTFAVGKIRVSESKLLKPSILYQLADSQTLEEMESILNATPYGKGLSMLNFDDSLDNEELTTLNELKNLVKDYRFLLPFFYKRDFHNLKLIAKSKFTKTDEGWLKEGLIEKEIISKTIAEGNISYLPEAYRKLLNEAWQVYERINQWQMIDVLLDKKLYEKIFEVTQELPFLNQFFQIELDLLNIKSLIRCKSKASEIELFVQLLVDGGLLVKSLFVEMYEKPINDFSGKLKFTPYYTLSDEGIPYLEETGRFYKIEQGCYSVLLDYLSCAKYTAFGYEPLLRYLFLKVNELRNLRTIFTCKLHGVEPEEIKERIGHFSG